jgi:hypothetical protein
MLWRDLTFNFSNIMDHNLAAFLSQPHGHGFAKAMWATGSGDDGDFAAKIVHAALL